MKTASDDADTLSLVHENIASDGLPDGESVITSKLDDTEFDFDFEIINTAAYRRVFNKVRSELPSKKGSQAVIPPHTPASSGAGASEISNLPSTNAPAANHAVVASQKNNFSSAYHPRLPEDSAEGAHDGSDGMREEQDDAGLEDHLSPNPKRSEYPLGEYTVGRTIGIGRRGKVKHAWKRDRSYDVAIKFIKREPAASDTNPTQKSLHELMKLKGLSHPNIIRVSDVLEAEKQFAVVREYIPGGDSLTEYIAEPTRLSDRDTQKLFTQIISAVGYLHREGIVHLGLSCSKIFLDFFSVPTLIGFLNMRTFDAERGPLTGDLMTDRLEDPYYSAPEASPYRLYEGRKADVWSCGIILVSTQYGLISYTNDVKYFMLAGYLPFADDPANPGVTTLDYG